MLLLLFFVAAAAAATSAVVGIRQVDILHTCPVVVVLVAGVFLWWW